MPIYRKPKNEWTKDGRSYYFRDYYTDMYGNRKQKESKLYKTKPECKDAEVEFLLKVKTTNEINTNIKFSEVYYEWLELKKRTIKSSTYYGWKHRIEKHILSYFKTFRLHNIKLNTINMWLDNMNNKNSSLEYINTLIGYLKEILSYAKDTYEFDNKILSRIQKYRIEKVNNKLKNSEINFWTYEEFNQFINCVDNNYYYILFNFLYYTGVRCGELAALTWKDINFSNRTVLINKTLNNKVGNGSYIITDPKTKNSNRIITLDDSLIELLKIHKKEEEKIYNFSETMFIFGNIKHLSNTTLANHLQFYIQKTRETIKDKNFKKITPHGFRHSHASLLIHLGCDSRDVAERLGDTIQIVESTYYHMFPSKKENTVNILNNLKKQEVNKR